MEHPYRQPGRVDRCVDDDARHDDRVLAVLLIVLGMVRVVPALWMGNASGTEPTIAGLMVIAGLAMILT